MFPFIRVPDSKRLSRIISSHPTFSNVPSGLIRDRDREALFDIRAPLSTRRFGTFGGKEGEVDAIKTVVKAPIGFPNPSILDPFKISEAEVLDAVESGKGMNLEGMVSDLERSMVGDLDLSPERKSFMDIIELENTLAGVRKEQQKVRKRKIKKELQAIRERGRDPLEKTEKDILIPPSFEQMFDLLGDTQGRGRRSRFKSATKSKRSKPPSRKTLENASKAGIKASQKGDIKTAQRVTEKKALEAGVPKSLAKTLGRQTGKAIKKHAAMESDEVKGIVDVAQTLKDVGIPEKKKPIRDEDIKRRKVEGTTTEYSGDPVAEMKEMKMRVPEMRFALKKIGYKKTTLNKPQLMEELSEVASRAGVSVKDILDAPQGGILSKRLMGVARFMGKTQRRFEVVKKPRIRQRKSKFRLRKQNR